MDDDIKNTIICGDNTEVMAGFEAGSIPTVITDPPYGLSFMGKRWDCQVPSVETWQAILRVLKPGGTLLCFAGSRTQHRMAVNVEDAGFILKDCIMWIYGSGFPKATDISKQIDKQAGAVREVVRVSDGRSKYDKHQRGSHAVSERESQCSGQQGVVDVTAPATAEAALWEGWKSHGLKPAYEPILVAMKPNDGSYANNALVHGVAGLNIDAGRIAGDKPIVTVRSYYKGKFGGTEGMGDPSAIKTPVEHKEGRYPANVIFDEQAAAMLDEQGGENCGAFAPVRCGHTGKSNGIYGDFEQKGDDGATFRGDTGGPSRFFYCAKASKSERNEGCEQLAEGQTIGGGGTNNTPDDVCGKYGSIKAAGRNHHPTVKPLDLMRYLCRLTSTPTGGCILDPFAGSGTTLVAAYLTGRQFIGIERDPGYVKIAEARIAAAKEKFSLFEQSQG